LKTIGRKAFAFNFESLAILAILAILLASVCVPRGERLYTGPMACENLFGFVLAGGKSVRMGADKAALTLEGRTLLEHALGIVGQVAGEVAILGPKQLYGGYGVRVIEDIYPGCGPLGGIHAALKHVAETAYSAKRGSGAPSSQAPFALIIAVDTPFLEPKFLAHLAQRARESGAVVTTPEIAGHTQPLCAVYSLDFLPIAERALKAGQRAQPEARTDRALGREASRKDSRPRQNAGTEQQKSADYKIVPLFPQGRTCAITETEMRKFAFTPEMFDNLNTPEDLERARRRTTKP
jgi:molybdenum cofactor guanylyltransferase